MRRSPGRWLPRIDFALSLRRAAVFVATFAVVAVIAWAVWPSDSPNLIIEQPVREADPVITAFWLESGGSLVAEARTIVPDIGLDINDGHTCLPSVEFKADRCSNLPGLFPGHVADLEALVARAEAMTAPAGTVAATWLRAHTSAWQDLLTQVRSFAVIAAGGFVDEEGWNAVQLQYEENSADLGAAELRMAEMLAFVDRDAVVSGFGREEGGG